MPSHQGVIVMSYDKRISKGLDKALKKMGQIQDEDVYVDLELVYSEDDDQKIIKVVEKGYSRTQ